MNYRTLGKTGLKVSAIGRGGYQLVSALDAPALIDAEVEHALAVVALAPAIDY